MSLKLYNSLSRQIEEFSPIYPPKVGLYTCGPTVYDFVTIGNWRTYTLGDLLVRALTYLGYKVDYIMNITDVGHLTGDNLGDADVGEDRMEKAARREHKTAWDIAKFYTNDFLTNYTKLNLSKPRLFTKATDHIKEQIELVQKIEKRGFAYKISDGIYFNVGAWEKAGHSYGELSNLDQIKSGARVEPNPDKKDQRDFALWKFSPRLRSGQAPRQMEWDSPWGVGFPGWHIECSAMSMKYLGEQFDIHVGGEDLKSTHHPNEIVQSEAATGKKPFVKYWMHGAFLQVNGGRMGKSLGNAYNLSDIMAKGFDPLALRYFYLTGYYRRPLNFTWEGLETAQKSLEKLRTLYQVISSGDPFSGSKSRNPAKRHCEEPKRRSLAQGGPRSDVSSDLAMTKQLQQKFLAAISNDLNMPEALAVVWETLKSNISDAEKYQLVNDWDRVLGLDLGKVAKVEKVAEEIKQLVKQRENLRKVKNWQEADEVRQQIEAKGFIVKDTAKGTVVKKNVVRKPF